MMTTNRRATLLSAILALGLAAPALHAAAAVDQPAPDFTLKDSHGKAHTLSGFKGKPVVLEWVNFECPFVVKHYQSENMQKLQKTFTDKGVIWLTICSSVPGSQGHYNATTINRLIAEKQAVPTAYLLDEKGDVGRLYGARTTPHMYVIDAAGTLIYAGAIDDKPTANLRDVDGAHNYVVAALEATLAGQPVTTKLTRPYGCGVKY